MSEKKKLNLKDKVVKSIKNISRRSDDDEDDNVVRSPGFVPLEEKGGFFGTLKRKMFGTPQAAMADIVPGRRWGDEWPKCMDDYQDVYERVSIVRKSINLISDFTISIGWDVKSEYDDLKKEIEEMRDRTNFSEVLKTAIKKREIWGFAAFEIVRDTNGNIVSFLPLDPKKFDVMINIETMEIDHFQYTVQGEKKKLDPEDVFYVTKDALDSSKKGISALESIKTTIKRKWNLEKDMEQAAKRLWAPYTLFKFDTSYVKDKEEQQKEIRKFINKIEPGKTIAHNQKVEPQIINMTPDIASLNDAIESADQEIIGNWGIPRALLSRERSVSQATLEFAIRSLYESSVASIQQYFKHEIENQIYDLIARDMDYSHGSAKHTWKPAKFHDSPVIRALTYSVKEGVISPKTMVTMLGWDVEDIPDDVDDDVKPRDRKPVDDRPISMEDMEDLLERKLSKLEEE